FHAQEDTAAALEEVILDAVQRRRVILVPSFAIGRTQELLWHLHQLIQAGRIPRIPIHVDSPMANATTLLYDRPREDMDPELRLDLTEGNSPFDSDMVHFVRARHESKALNEMEGPRLIISGSGMATGGRIVHHLAQRLGDPSTVVLFTGFQARGTLGRRLIEKEPEVRILGREFTVRAEIRKLNSLSAHADQGEMMEWLRRFARPPKRVYLVHGEPPAQEALAGRIREELGWTVEIPEEGQSFSLD
ncbi:MAG: hypothetical protein MH204_08695, partial [Fimbriimonadaceae bacterium]|nr:hypothetical protein [Fimbriimonadaceae bacterium]